VATPATIRTQAKTGGPETEAFEKMARRRFQDPTPRRRGKWWVIDIRRDVFVDGKHKRVQAPVRIAPADKSFREAQKISTEYLRPMNQQLESIGSATNFNHYVDNTYIPIVMPLLAKSTRDRYRGVIDNYLQPAFGKLCLRDLTPLSVQRYFSQMATSDLAHGSRDKIRDVLSSVMGSAVQYGVLISNPVENVRMPAERRGRTVSCKSYSDKPRKRWHSRSWTANSAFRNSGGASGIRTPDPLPARQVQPSSTKLV